MQLGMDFETLIDRWRGALVGLLAAWGASPRDAVELAQDTFAEAYMARKRFIGSWEDDNAVGPWLRGIARNLHANHVRRRSPGGQQHVALDRVEETASPAGEASDARLEELLAAIGRLREPWREVLLMRYVEGIALTEIAALLGLGERAVEGRLRRARKELEQIITSEGSRAIHTARQEQES